MGEIQRDFVNISQNLIKSPLKIYLILQYFSPHGNPLDFRKLGGGGVGGEHFICHRKITLL